MSCLNFTVSFGGRSAPLLTRKFVLRCSGNVSLGFRESDSSETVIFWLSAIQRRTPGLSEVGELRFILTGAPWTAVTSGAKYFKGCWARQKVTLTALSYDPCVVRFFRLAPPCRSFLKTQPHRLPQVHKLLWPQPAEQRTTFSIGHTTRTINSAASFVKNVAVSRKLRNLTVSATFLKHYYIMKRWFIYYHSTYFTQKPRVMNCPLEALLSPRNKFFSWTTSAFLPFLVYYVTRSGALITYAMFPSKYRFNSSARTIPVTLWNFPALHFHRKPCGIQAHRYVLRYGVIQRCGPTIVKDLR